mmetsp:Transcript_102760/g.257719  ORF Transcript_102760/g.257719 Transcript_102760/m.257719 type:complete len:211 (+) Transcript_102760:255-887(+)
MSRHTTRHATRNAAHDAQNHATPPRQLAQSCPARKHSTATLARQAAPFHLAEEEDANISSMSSRPPSCPEEKDTTCMGSPPRRAEEENQLGFGIPKKLPPCAFGSIGDTALFPISEPSTLGRIPVRSDRTLCGCTDTCPDRSRVGVRSTMSISPPSRKRPHKCFDADGSFFCKPAPQASERICLTTWSWSKSSESSEVYASIACNKASSR